MYGLRAFFLCVCFSGRQLVSAGDASFLLLCIVVGDFWERVKFAGTTGPSMVFGQLGRLV